MVGKFIKEADNVAGDILKDFREGLIMVGRVLLVSTFIEDAIRMWHQWHDHKDYIGTSWSFTDEIATFIVLLNLVGQCLGLGVDIIQNFRKPKFSKTKIFKNQNFPKRNLTVKTAAVNPILRRSNGAISCACNAICITA